MRELPLIYVSYQHPLGELLRSLALAASGLTDADVYGANIKNDVFTMRRTKPNTAGDCDCLSLHTKYFIYDRQVHQQIYNAYVQGFADAWSEVLGEDDDAAYMNGLTSRAHFVVTEGGCEACRANPWDAPNFHYHARDFRACWGVMIGGGSLVCNTSISADDFFTMRRACFAALHVKEHK